MSLSLVFAVWRAEGLVFFLIALLDDLSCLERAYIDVENSFSVPTDAYAASG